MASFAYFLITCDPDKINQVFEQLRNLDEIKEFQGTNGPYDIIAKSETKSSSHSLIIRQIGAWIGVRSTLALMCKPDE
ncbi:MAG: Lrp/AsnC ligand binding domain-containing protein [Nitrosopumilaceae archaeon]|nr:Lrp/AsnC ligand binding domain-containing protein [Nitrosopumilaceae archaeon]